MSNKEYKNDLSIEDLSEEVEKLLRKYGLLNNQNDRRINAVPDPRTIRYYTTLGLLESPQTVNRQARYNQNHIIQLSVIKALQAQSFTLAEIQTKLYGKRIEEVEQLLSIISSNSKKQNEIIVTSWNEVIIEPGLKIMVDSLWKANYSIDELTEKIKDALIALNDNQTQDKRRN